MYCTRCGKKIDYDALICNECAAASGIAQSAQPAQPPVQPTAQPQPMPTYQQPTYQPQARPMPAKPSKPKGSMTYGIGGGIAAAILGFISFIFFYIALAWLAAGAIGGTVLILVCLVLGIIGLIKGIGAIKDFRASSMVQSTKPIPTLVLGIVGTVLNGITLFILFFVLVGVLAALA